jgi:hypothetical protein
MNTMKEQFIFYFLVQWFMMRENRSQLFTIFPIIITFTFMLLVHQIKYFPRTLTQLKYFVCSIRDSFTLR